MKRKVIIGGAAAGALAVGALGVGLWATTSAGPTGASPTAAPSSPSLRPTIAAPTPAATSAPGALGDDGADLVSPFLVAESTARQSPDVDVSFADVATGRALDDVTVSAYESMENGLTQVGDPTLVSAKITTDDTSAVPATVTVLVCLDYSGVDVVGPDGVSAKADDAPERVPSILTLVQSENRWLVSERTFPDDPTC